jgi:nucleoside-diphosphate-sugar epimerase
VKLAGSSSTIAHVEPRPAEIERRKPDAGRAEAELGWTARRTLEEGLARTIAWYRDELAREAIPGEFRADPARTPAR